MAKADRERPPVLREYWDGSISLHQVGMDLKARVPLPDHIRRPFVSLALGEDGPGSSNSRRLPARETSALAFGAPHGPWHSARRSSPSKVSSEVSRWSSMTRRIRSAIWVRILDCLLSFCGGPASRSMSSSSRGTGFAVATSMRPDNDLLPHQKLNRRAYLLERRNTCCQDESSCSFGSSP